MITPDEETQDELARAYRNASDSDAGKPGAATRAAILAEARAAALRRTPAANDSRYIWRAAAGVAVLGVALLLWRQADRKLAPDLTVATAERAAEMESKSAPPAVEMTSTADANPAPTQASADKAAEPSARMEQAVARPAAPQARERDDATVNAAGALDRATTDYPGLLQREFPEVWSDVVTPRVVWLVMDAQGRTVRKGVIDGEAIPPGAWNYTSVVTASGRFLQLAVMQTD